jgi:hypothetical protein
MTNKQLTDEEYEHMRELLGKHDMETGKNQPQEFDLNNPPSKPYQFKEFPKIMFHHGGRAHRTANNADEQKALEKAGWQVDPYPRRAEPVSSEGEYEEDQDLLDELEALKTENENLKAAKKGKKDKEE